MRLKSISLNSYLWQDSWSSVPGTPSSGSPVVSSSCHRCICFYLLETVWCRTILRPKGTLMTHAFLEFCVFVALTWSLLEHISQKRAKIWSLTGLLQVTSSFFVMEVARTVAVRNNIRGKIGKTSSWETFEKNKRL